MIELSRRGRVAVLTLNRPPVNAINDAMIDAIHSALHELAGHTDWSVLHVRSTQKIFAAGADLDLVQSWTDAPTPSLAFSAYIDRLQALYQRLVRLPQVTFCEIGGAAMGGGFELALSCDLRMAAADVKIGLPEVGLGLIPAAGGTQRLTRLCGRGVASRIILGGEAIDGRTAETLGMVEWSVPRPEIEERARTVTDHIATLPAAALQAVKQCILAATDDSDRGYHLERDLGGALLNGAETQELISAFLAKNSKPRQEKH